MSDGFIPPHGGYKNLISYQKSLIVYDATFFFCNKYINKRNHTFDQMIQAARSGKQNIVEGSMASGTSKETDKIADHIAAVWLEYFSNNKNNFYNLK